MHVSREQPSARRGRRNFCYQKAKTECLSQPKLYYYWEYNCTLLPSICSLLRVAKQAIPATGNHDILLGWAASASSSSSSSRTNAAISRYHSREQELQY